MHIRQDRFGIQDIFLKCQIDCEYYRNGFPKKVARGLDADREVKAIFLAGKQSTAVESSKIWQHALCASTRRLFLGERIFSRRAHEGDRWQTTIQFPYGFAVIASLMITASFSQSAGLNSARLAVRPFNCITRSVYANIDAQGRDISIIRRRWKKGESVLRSRLKSHVVD